MHPEAEGRRRLRKSALCGVGVPDAAACPGDGHPGEPNLRPDVHGSTRPRGAQCPRAWPTAPVTSENVARHAASVIGGGPASARQRAGARSYPSGCRCSVRYLRVIHPAVARCPRRMRWLASRAGGIWLTATVTATPMVRARCSGERDMKCAIMAGEKGARGSEQKGDPGTVSQLAYAFGSDVLSHPICHHSGGVSHSPVEATRMVPVICVVLACGRIRWRFTRTGIRIPLRTHETAGQVTAGTLLPCQRLPLARRFG